MLVHPVKEACVIAKRDHLHVLASHDPRTIGVVLGQPEAIGTHSNVCSHARKAKGWRVVGTIRDWRGVNLGRCGLWRSERTSDQKEGAMIGVPVEHKLAMTCEHRLGRIVDVASVFNLQRVASPIGDFEPRKSLRVVLALADGGLWLLEFRYWAVGFDVSGVLFRLPRVGLASQWRHRWWAWPAVWKAELSWPGLATYITGSLIGGDDADRIMGLLAADAFNGAQPIGARAERGWSD
jgi:hypothetical protein